MSEPEEVKKITLEEAAAEYRAAAIAEDEVQAAFWACEDAYKKAIEAHAAARSVASKRRNEAHSAVITAALEGI